MIVYGQHDERTLGQMKRCLEAGSAAAGVLCADGHLGYGHPIGGVVGYTDHISVSGVGFDIACGNMAVRLDTPYAEIADRIDAIVNDIARSVSFGVGRKNEERVDHGLFDDESAWKDADALHLRELAQAQLGTVGSGNHYVDVFEDQDGKVWIGVHFGSRGLGHKITTAALKRAGASDSMDADPALLPIGNLETDVYLAGIDLAGRYAYAGRQWVVEKVRSIIGGEVSDQVHNHHNYVWSETHLGQAMWVVRKGATPAFPGQRGFVGGSMGDIAVVLRGVNSEESAAALFSTVHGAGRVMSRTDARGKRDKRTGEWKREPRVDREEWRSWLRNAGVTLAGGDLDEAPQAYRRLPDVLELHKNTVEIEHTLRPRGVVMAGAGEVDPYKD
ncbi:RtcB family protein [Amorphus sp. MBR-141]